MVERVLKSLELPNRELQRYKKVPWTLQFSAGDGCCGGAVVTCRAGVSA